MPPNQQIHRNYNRHHIHPYHHKLRDRIIETTQPRITSRALRDRLTDDSGFVVELGLQNLVVLQQPVVLQEQLLGLLLQSVDVALRLQRFPLVIIRLRLQLPHVLAQLGDFLLKLLSLAGGPLLLFTQGSVLHLELLDLLPGGAGGFPQGDELPKVVVQPVDDKCKE